MHNGIELLIKKISIPFLERGFERHYPNIQIQ